MIGKTNCYIFSQMPKGTPLSELTEGTLVKANEVGVPVEFYLAKHDYEPGLNGDGRDLILRKSIYDERKWNNSANSAWDTCSLRSWLNGGYKALFDPALQELMGATKYYYTKGNGNNTLTTRSDAVFVLSATEYGYPAANFNVEGVALPISGIIKKDGVSKWTRTSDTYATENVISAYYNDTARGISPTNVIGNCPCFTLPADVRVDDDLNIIVA